MGEEEKNKKIESKDNNYIKVTFHNEAEFTFYNKKYGDPMKLLEELYAVRENEVLTNEEKNTKVQKIMTKYME